MRISSNTAESSIDGVSYPGTGHKSPSRPVFAETTVLTSQEVASLLQVNRSSVNNWIREGYLPAFRTPGGHRRVQVSDLLTFLAAKAMPIPAVLRPRPSLRVMVVDDEPLVLESTRRSLERCIRGVEVQAFESAISALLSVPSFDPGLIILDVYMPEIDGLEACRRLKARPETAAIELVITSGALTPELVSEAIALGVSACLAKPFSPQQLLEVASATLRLPAE